MTTLEIKTELGAQDFRNGTTLVDEAERYVLYWRGLMLDTTISYITLRERTEYLYQRLYDERWTGSPRILNEISHEAELKYKG